MTLTLPIRTVTESNAKEHWATKAKRAASQRYETYIRLRTTWQKPPALPCTITVTRIAPRMLDVDNCISSLKHVIDGCADWLAGPYLCGEDRQPGLHWHYNQRRGKPHEYAVEITIEEDTHAHL